jgi:hypothetical protein
MRRLKADSPWVLVALAVAFALVTTVANLLIGAT